MSEADVWHRRGVAAFERGDLMSALEALSQAIALDGSRADIHGDIGVVAHRARAWDLAEEHFKRALALTPNAASLNYNLGNLFKNLGRFAEAEDCFRRAVTDDPTFAPAHNNLGNVLKQLKRWGEAAEAYRAAVAADPDFAPAHRNHADLDETLGRTREAIAGFGRAAGLRKDDGARIRAALAMPVIADSVGEIEDTRARIAENLAELAGAGLRLGDPLAQVGATPFHLAYHGRDDRPLMESLAELYRGACPSLSFTAPHCRDWLGGLEGGPIRVGFASAFLRDHTIAHLNERLIEKLPRDRFDVRLFDRLPRDLAAARDELAAAELDILYFTDIGMEPLTYFLAFARLAPVQCVSWGHPVTSGISSLDYFVSGRAIEPDGAEAVYTERLVRLDTMPASVAAPGNARAEPNGPAFLCPQSLFKLHPDFDPLIGRILARCPESELVLLAGQHPEWERVLEARWRRTIPDVVDRVRFVPRRDRTGFMALLASARVVLDTPHFCGGLSSLEALSAGTPVVALPGDFMRSRVTLGLYRRMGMTDLVAKDGDEYVDLAVRLARDDGFHAEMQRRIRALAPRLIDDPAPISEHAAFFEEAVYGAV